MEKAPGATETGKKVSRLVEQVEDQGEA